MKHGLAKLCVLMSSNDKKNLHVDYFEKRYEQANEKVDKIGHFFTVRLYPYLSFPTCVIGIYFMYKGYSSELGEKNLYLLLAPATVLAYYVIAYFIAVIFLFVEYSFFYILILKVFIIHRIIWNKISQFILFH